MKPFNLTKNSIAKLISLLVALPIVSTSCAQTKQTKSMKIVMIIASTNFRDEEFEVPKTIFEQNNCTVTVASSSLNECVGTLGDKVKPDLLLQDVKVEQYDAVVFVGGGGAKEYFDNEIALNLAKQAYTKGKVIAAICIAPNILANAGILKGKKATCNDSKNLIEKGAIYSGKPVDNDGKIITGKDPAAAKEFASAVVVALGK